MSAFLGIINILTKPFLFCVEEALYVAELEKHELFEIKKIYLVPFEVMPSCFS